MAVGRAVAQPRPAAVRALARWRRRQARRARAKPRPLSRRTSSKISPASNRSSSPHRRDDEFGAFLGARRPARGHRLGLGIEADRIRAVLIEVAEAGAFPAAEGVVGERHRDREIDADHADLDAVGEIARGVAVAGEDGNAVAVFMLRRQPHRLLVILGADHRQDGSENLFLVDRHVRLDVVEQAAADEIALLVALELEIAAVDHELGAFLDALIDIAADLVEELPGHHRAVVGLRVGRGADLEAFDAGDQFFHQNVGSLLADRHGDRHRHAALAGGAVAGADQRIDRLVHVGVRHHDHVVLGAAKALHPFAVGGAGRVNIFGDRGRADKADRLYARVREQRVDCFLVAVDDIEHARRQPGFQKQFGDAHRHRRIALRRLENEAIAAGDRRGAFPQRDHGRKIERRNAGDDAERLAHRVKVDAGTGTLAVFALYQVRDAAGELDHFQPALDVAFGIGKGLAVLGRQQPRQIVVFALDQLQELEHDPGAALRIGGGPGRERRLGVGDGLLDLGLVGKRHLGLHLAGIGIEHVALPPRSAVDLLAADEVADVTHGWSPWKTHGTGPDGFDPIVLVFSATVTGANAPDGGAERFVGYFADYSIPAGAWRMKYQDIITAEEGKRGGRPCIRGLRITVGDVLGWLAAGLSHAQILADYPELTEDDIRACLAHAADRESGRPPTVTKSHR